MANLHADMTALTARLRNRRLARQRNAKARAALWTFASDGLALAGTVLLVVAMVLLAQGVDMCALGDYGLAACG